MVLQSKATNKDIAVATYSQVPTLLPVVDKVAFVRVPSHYKYVEQFGWADWDGVRRALGQRMKPMGLYPERYCLEGEITEAEMAAMGIRPVEEGTL